MNNSEESKKEFKDLSQVEKDGNVRFVASLLDSGYFDSERGESYIVMLLAYIDDIKPSIQDIILPESVEEQIEKMLDDLDLGCE